MDSFLRMHWSRRLPIQATLGALAASLTTAAFADVPDVASRLVSYQYLDMVSPPDQPNVVSALVSYQVLRLAGR